MFHKRTERLGTLEEKMSKPWEKCRYFYCAERERVKCQKGTFYESESHTNADTEEFEQQCFQKASMMGRSLVFRSI
jgi:hypothetical protein